MNKFTQHIPPFCDGVEREVFEFSTLDELLNHPIIKRCRIKTFDGKETPYERFHRYSMSDNSLMAEFNHGKEWWVIGYIKNPKELDLPEWEPIIEGEK